jgi:hypothetical protein
MVGVHVGRRFFLLVERRAGAPPGPSLQALTMTVMWALASP